MGDILITGAAGFVGSRVAAALARAGHRVVGCDHLGSGAARELARERVRAWLDPARVRCVDVDLAEGDALDHLCTVHRFDTIVHLAVPAPAGPGGARPAPADSVPTRLASFAQVLDAARRHRVDRLLHASSVAVYAAGEAQPVVESARIDRPSGLDAAVWSASETMARAAAGESGLQALALRLFPIYGPWGSLDLPLHRLARAVREGRTLQLPPGAAAGAEIAFIDDVVDDIVALVELRTGWGARDALNLARPQPFRLVDLVHALGFEFGRAVRIGSEAAPAGQLPLLAADDRGLQTLLGARRRTPLVEGVRALAQWLDEWSPPQPAPLRLAA